MGGIGPRFWYKRSCSAVNSAGIVDDDDDDDDDVDCKEEEKEDSHEGN
jgi:hypothetical protein